MDTLDKLALEHKTDKCSRGHGYTDAYDIHFSCLRHDKIRLLEIGVWRGASLRMWNDYFTQGYIVGIDKTLCTVEGERIATEMGDQTDALFLARVNQNHGPFDIIIDDGGHTMRQQQQTAAVLFPMLSPGGIYVVEDLHTSYDKDFHDAPLTTIEYMKSLIDDINLNGKRANGLEDLTQKEGLTYNEQHISFMSVYRSIVFIGKR